MKIPIRINDEVLHPDAIVLIKDRDQKIEAVYLGEPAVEVVAQTIPCNLENRVNLEQALAEGWEFFCAIMPTGYAKFLLKEPKWIAAAQKIAVSIDKDCLRRMPPGNTVKQ